MVKAVNIGKEIVVTEKNKVGILADIAKLVSDHGINIEAVAGYSGADGVAKIMIVTNDNLRAKEAIQKKGYKEVKESEVVIVELENKIGALKNITAKFVAENIDIRYMYATTCPAGCPARLVFSTTANEKAVVSLKK
ncbi:MAG: ACT domain-containing protein [Candidatus Omnitrophica bacterium]|nr:ACT domain-containing protein [Candidatus Omnitrophota bacterium]